MQDSFDGGELRVGEMVVFLYIDQLRELFDLEKFVFEEIIDGQEEIFIGKFFFFLLWSICVFICIILLLYFDLFVVENINL